MIDMRMVGFHIIFSHLSPSPFRLFFLVSRSCGATKKLFLALPTTEEQLALPIISFLASYPT